MLSTRALITILAALATTVHGHGAMVAVTGANGVTGAGLGINPATPRDGTRRNPFQQDTSIINDKEIASGKSAACGRTLGGGVNDIASGVAG
jgi:Egh16-like virulence factor